MGLMRTPKLDMTPISSQITGVKNTVDTVNTNVATGNTNIASVKTTTETVNTNLSATKGVVDTVKNNVDTSITKLNTAQQGIDYLKQSAVDLKNSLVNAINGKIGYVSGLTATNTGTDFAWWIANKIKSMTLLNSSVEIASVRYPYDNGSTNIYFYSVCFPTVSDISKYMRVNTATCKEIASSQGATLIYINTPKGLIPLKVGQSYSWAEMVNSSSSTGLGTVAFGVKPEPSKTIISCDIELKSELYNALQLL